MSSGRLVEGLADDHTFERQDLDRNTIDHLIEGTGIFDVESLQAVRCQDDVDPLEAVAAEPRGVQTECCNPEPAGITRREPHRVVSWAFKPEVEILCTDRRSLKDGGAEPDDEVTDSTLVQCFQQPAFSGREREVVHVAVPTPDAGWASTEGSAERDRGPIRRYPDAPRNFVRASPEALGAPRPLRLLRRQPSGTVVWRCRRPGRV
jgi:hypothetical protein